MWKLCNLDWCRKSRLRAATPIVSSQLSPANLMDSLLPVEITIELVERIYKGFTGLEED